MDRMRVGEVDMGAAFDGDGVSLLIETQSVIVERSV